MFALTRTPLASPTLKHAFTHAKAFPFHLPSLPSPGLGSPMQMTPLISPEMLVPAAHVLPNYNSNPPTSPNVATPMSPAMLVPAAHVLPNGRMVRPNVDRQFTMPAYPFPTMTLETPGFTSRPYQPKTRPPRGPAGLSKVVSGKISKSGKASALKRKANMKLRLNPKIVVINEDDLLADAMKLANIEEDQGIKFGGFKSITERVPTPFPPTQRPGGWLRELDAIDLWL